MFLTGLTFVQAETGSFAFWRYKQNWKKVKGRGKRWKGTSLLSCLLLYHLFQFQKVAHRNEQESLSNCIFHCRPFLHLRPPMFLFRETWGVSAKSRMKWIHFACHSMLICVFLWRENPKRNFWFLSVRVSHPLCRSVRVLQSKTGHLKKVSADRTCVHVYGVLYSVHVSLRAQQQTRWRF